MTAFTTTSDIRRELEEMLNHPSDTVLWSMFMHSSIGCYLLVRKHQTEGGTVREAAQKALEGLA